MNVGDRIRQARIDQALSLTELARRAQISVSYLSEIERGRKEPSARTLTRLYRELDMPAENGGEEAEQAISLGDKVRLARQEKGLTQARLAEITGVTPTHVSDIERSAAQPTPEVLRRLAEALECPVSLLMSDAAPGLGAKVKSLRRELGLSQRQLAMRTGVSAAMIGQIEKGRIQPSLRSVESLAEGLGVSPCYLVVDTYSLQEMAGAMGPDLLRLLSEDNVQSILRMLCHLQEKEIRYLLMVIDAYKRAGL